MVRTRLIGRAEGPPDSDRAPESVKEAFALYQRRYTALIATIPSSVLLIDPDLVILAANENFLRKARRNERETLGRRLDEVLPPVIVEHINLREQAHRVFDTGEALRGQRMTYRAPGVPLRTYYYSIVPLTSGAETPEALLLMDDVTEQIRLSEEIRNVERHLASVVESASDIIISTSPDGRVLSWNTAAERVTGYHAEEVRGRLFSSLLDAPSQGPAKTAFMHPQSLANLKEPEWRLVSRGGEGVGVSWVFSTMRDEGGSIAGVVAIGRDLTERRKLESEILQAQKLTALGVMAGGIAHEIRNPLAVCSVASQFLMAEHLAPDFVHECAERIQNGVKRACFIIENLLRFGRPSATAAMERLDLCPLIHSTLALLGNEAKLQKVALQKQTPHEPIYVRGNPGLLQQMLMNLVFNGLKAMAEGGELTVTLEPDNSEAVLRVTDTGCGIPADQLDKIFDPFYTTRPVGEGTGLGLSLCYAIVRQHSGEIEVKSVVNSGSVFTVRLPVSAS